MPGKVEDYEGVKLGSFLDNLLGGKRYKNDRDQWIIDLLDIKSVKIELQERIDKRKNETAKVSRTMKPEKRFKLLKQFCENKHRLPHGKETYEDINLKSFLYCLITGKIYTNDRNQWIEELLSIESVRDEFKKRIIKRGTYPFDDIDERDDE